MSTETKRTQAERTEATRAALIAAARRLFAEHGYAAVATEQIVKQAGVTRGALYHHFDGKRDLLRAVYEQIEAELARRLGEAVDPEAGSLETLAAGAALFLDACLEPEVQRIALHDAPAVLGWEEWREIDMRHGLGLITASLTGAMEAGILREQPVRPLAHLLLAAMGEAALMIANADDPHAVRDEMEASLLELLEALRA